MAVKPPLLERIKREIRFYRLLLNHPETPKLARWSLILALAYLASPVDLIPDFVPVLGQLDDLVIVGGLVLLAHWVIPNRVIDQCQLLAKHCENSSEH